MRWQIQQDSAHSSVTLPLLMRVRITFEQICDVVRRSPRLYFVFEIVPRFYFDIPLSLRLFVKITYTILIHF